MSVPDIHDQISEIEYEHIPSVMMYGIDVPTGWYPVIIDLHEQMLPVDDGYIFLSCNKENGKLRVSIDTQNIGDKERAEHVTALVENAKRYVLATCEICSEDGEPDTFKGWAGVLCPRHWKERKAG